MLDRVGMIRARPLEHLLEMIQGTLDGCLLALALSSGYE
jgi:hypothetical protein